MRHMLGFAVIDAPEGSGEIAIWLTTRTTSSMADHTNAVVLPRNGDRTHDVYTAMTADRIVLLTPGTELDCDPAPMTFDSLDRFADATQRLYDDVVAAITAYGKRTRSPNLVTPPRPEPRTYIEPPEDIAPARALATANYLSRLWRDWLQIEEERRRRTVTPRTGETPWMMPPELNSPAVAEIPSAVSERFAPVPLYVP